VSTLKPQQPRPRVGKDFQKVRVMTRNISSSSWCKGSQLGRTSRPARAGADCLKVFPRVKRPGPVARGMEQISHDDVVTPVGHAHESAGIGHVHSEANAIGRKIVVRV